MRRWIYTSLAIMAAAATTWALHATQESWRPPSVAVQESQPDVGSHAKEIEALEAELERIQLRLDELRARPRR